ncbi:rod shape-determining protein MreD [Tissierella sp. MB52-C2]|uniref:rod shape-determining protein MreD n=1 Tax=Tissierella sp. MB52-C2 TaxID=3070999 RepID=UPI00280C1198|nr:rod shape-determining protein MreD [Tissierella sp. MB52-C2]WMM23556.1 rod shape-determining protein MreD [Tissierella sp. MB52-C2]
MIVLVLSLITLLNLFLQSSILPYISIFGVVPNTALLIIICIALYKGRIYGGVVGLIIGIIQDIIFSPVLGISSFIYFFVGYLIGLVQNKLSKDNILIPILFSILGTIFYSFSYYIFMFFLSHEIPFLYFARDVLIIEIIYNIILCIPIYKIFSKIFVVPKIRFGSR